MTKTVSTLLLLTLAGTAALAAPKRPAASRRPAAPKAPAAHAAPKQPLAPPTTPVAAAPTLAVAASPATSEITLYDGKAAGPTAPSVADWGGGSGQDSTETYLFGGHSLKVTTLDLFQGARITFPTPVSLAGDNRVFQLTLRRGGATLHYDPQTTSPLPPGDSPNVAFPGAGGPGGFGAPGRFQGRNGRRRGGFQTRGAENNTAQIPPVTNLRLSFTFADGRQADTLRPVPDAADTLAGEGWYSVNVPIAALKLSAGADPLLKSVTVGGDHYGVFFVGRIKLGMDTPTLAITIDGPDSVLPGQPAMLTAKGGSVFSTLKYAWDLDGGDQAGQLAGPGQFAGPGQLAGPAQPQTDTQVTARYFEPGQDHTVTLTVTDPDGLKQPLTVTKVIHVKEQANGPGGFPGAAPGGMPGGRLGGFPGAGPGVPQRNGTGTPPDSRRDE